MHHYFEAITNKSGDSLPGYFARVVDPATQNTVTLAADNNGTPIVTTSGVENAAKTDENGNVSFYVAPGTYHLDIYAQNATSFIMRVSNVAMNSGVGPQGEQGPEGPQGEGLEEVMAPTGAALVGFQQPSAGAVPLDVRTVLSRVIDPADFGAKLDGVTDDAPAWRAAIKAARDRGLSLVRSSYGVTGVSLCDSPIWNNADGPYPPGIWLDGSARNTVSNVGAGAGYSAGITFKYTGAAPFLWANYSAGAAGGLPGETGQWRFSNFTLVTTNSAADGFRFNDPNQPVVEPGGASYLRGIVFDNVHLFGAAQGSPAQTGRAISAAKCFKLEVLGNCHFRDWQRGIYLLGCDDCSIDARLTENGRHIMSMPSSTFGSGLQITCNQFGRTLPTGGEPAYLLYDAMNNTAVNDVLFEVAGLGSATALMYLNGRGTKVVNCAFAGAPMFELGPQASEILIDNPSASIAPDEWKAIIAPPSSTDFGYEQQDKRIVIRNASLNYQVLAGAHPRIDYVGQAQGQGSIPTPRNALVEAAGSRNRSLVLSARKYWGKSFGTPALGGVEFVTDTAANCGWAIKCNKDTLGAGFFAVMTIGKDFAPGDKLSVRLRSRNSTASPDSWRLAVMKNSDGSDLSRVVNSRASYGVDVFTVDVTGYVVGDRLSIGIQLAATPTTDLFIDAMSLTVTSAAIADLTAAPTAADYNALLAVMRRFDMIAT